MNLWGQVITLRGQILVSRTGDDTLPFPRVSVQNVPVCPSKTSPCVRPTRLRVHLQHAHMLKSLCARCWHTRGRFERTHGVFSACHTTPHTHHDHNDTHTTQHSITHNVTPRQGQRGSERQGKKTEKEDRGRARREDGRGETRQEKTR